MQISDVMQLLTHTWLTRWLLAQAYHDMEKVSWVVGQSEAVSRDELLIALIAIVAVQGMPLHQACMLSAIASHCSNWTVEQGIGDVT